MRLYKAITAVVYTATVALLVIMLFYLHGCSGSGFVTVGGSGAIYNPNNEHAPEIVRNQPTQAITIGRASIALPMVKRGEK